MAIPLPPGVPPLLKPPTTINGITNVVNTAALLIADAKLIASLLNPPKWGLYRKGVQVIKPDSIISIDYRQDAKISDHPLEDGAFETYNKVGTPYDIRIRMCKGGTQAERTEFLKTCEMLVNSFDVYDVVTPEKTYINANVQRYDYARSATNGVGLLTVEMSIIEIRRFAKATKLTAAKPAGADPVNKGRVQASKVTDFVGVIPSGAAKPAITNFVGVFK